MLTSLKISKLFGLYDYDLSFSNLESDKIRFLTATNGYGKSTILRLIDGLFNHHLEVFFKIPFSKLEYTIDNVVCQISQTTIPNPTETQDNPDDIVCHFCIGTEAGMQEAQLTLFGIDSHNEQYDIVLQQIDMFFSSETCKFIDDRRLLRENNNNGSELIRLSEHVKEQMQHPSAMFDEQMHVLTHIVERSDFSNKHIEFDTAYGFRFVANDANHTKLTMSQLSSGEQHIMLITLYMLFEAPEKAIILIDEPEMSFHLSWQGDYLRNLREIVSLRNVQCIIATHSPIIFGSEYALAIDLFEQMNPMG